MKWLLFGLLALAWGQELLPFLPSGNLVDTIHGYGVEYDDNHNIVIFVGATDCYIVVTDREAAWDNTIHTPSLLHAFTDAVYKQIVAGIGLHVTTLADISTHYHSTLVNAHCRTRTVYMVTYVGPSTT